MHCNCHTDDLQLDGGLLPDVWVRMMGILEIAALPALVYAGVKKK